MDATKIIAGLIFGPLLLFPVLASVYFAYDRGEILLNSDWEKGVVTACPPERASSRSKTTVRSRRSSTVYRAEVQSESNGIIKAALAPTKSKQCKNTLVKPSAFSSTAMAVVIRFCRKANVSHKKRIPIIAMAQILMNAPSVVAFTKTTNQVDGLSMLARRR